MRYIFSILLLFCSYIIQAQSEIYIVDEDGILYLINTTDCSATTIGDTDNIFYDIAINPLNSEMYGVDNLGFLYNIDPATGVSTAVSTGFLGPLIGANALTFDENGILYGSGSDASEIISIDTNTGEIIEVWPNNTNQLSAGDLTFYNGSMYMTSNTGFLVEIEIENPSNATVLGQYQGGELFFGITTAVSENCVPIIFAFADNDVYLLPDDNLLNPMPLCDNIIMPNSNDVYGAASFTETINTDCNDDDCTTVDTFNAVLCQCEYEALDCSNGEVTTEPCDDGNANTENDEQGVLCDGTVCVPCTGIMANCPEPTFGTFDNYCNNDGNGIVDLTTFQNNTGIIGDWTVSNDASMANPITITGNTLNYTNADIGNYEITFTINDPNIGAGCATIFPFPITIGSDVTELLNVEACTGQNYNFDGTDIPAGMTMSFPYLDTDGCDSIITVSVTEVTTITESIALQACTGTTAIFDGTDVAIGETMDFTYTSTNGCDSIVTVSVSEVNSFSENVELQACTGTTATFDGTDLAIGANMEFTYTTVNGCDSIVNVTVLEVAQIMTTLDTFICINSSIIFEGETLMVGESSDFTYSTTEGCDSIFTLNVFANAIAPTDIEVFVCEGESYELNGENIAINESQVLTLMSQQGCDSMVMVSVLAYDPVVITPLDTIDLIQGQSITVQPSSTANNPIYAWSPNDGLNCNDCATPTVSPDQSTTYTLTIEDGQTGCAQQTNLVVIVEDLIINELHVVNAFSPNGDGINETLFTQTTGNPLESFTLQVFNRWGQQVFESNDINAQWDGTLDNELQTIGVFILYAEATFSDNETIIKKGNVTLVR